MHRFFFGHEVLELAAGDWVDQDMRRARLSHISRLYYLLRPSIPIALRQKLQHARAVVADENWYLPHAYISHLAETAATLDQPVHVVHPWPDNAQTALVVTHDIETADGWKNVDQIATLEEALGIRSSWNLVPHKYPIDHGLVRDLKDRGFEIGIHGYNHDGKLFWSERVFRQRAAKINEAIDQYGAAGFRTPMVHRNLAWMQQLRIQYDSSCFDMDPYQTMPGGVGSIWPFLAGRFVELPYTLPQDHTLLVARKEPILPTWQTKARFIRKHHGMILLLTHPDYLMRDRDLAEYEEFLRWASEFPNAWHGLPREVADWWRQRQAMQLTRGDNGKMTISGPAAHRARIAELVGVDGELRIDCNQPSP